MSVAKDVFLTTIFSKLFSMWNTLNSYFQLAGSAAVRIMSLEDKAESASIELLETFNQ